MTAATPSSHAPELGPMRRWLGGLHFTGVFWYRLHRFGVRILPEWGIRLFILLFTTFFFLTLGRVRRSVGANLEVVLGPCSWWRRQRRVYCTLWNFAWCMSERYERLETGVENTESAEGVEHWEQAMGEVYSGPRQRAAARRRREARHGRDNAIVGVDGAAVGRDAARRGVVLVTAHIGHWEIGAMQVNGRHVHVVREDEIDPKAAAFIRELFCQPGEDPTGFTMHFANNDPSFGLRLVAALRKGDLVAVQGDRPRSSGRSCQVEVFGRPLELAVGPAALARAAGVVLLPVFVFRLGRRRSGVVMRPPIAVTGGGKKGLQAAMQKVAGEVEWAIRRDPLQWFCFRRLWP